MKTILIIGAGFCGAVTAVQLLSRAGARPTRVILLNRSGLMARGLAYGTQSHHHVLNVPAGNMSALIDEPDHFLQFVRAFAPETGSSSFVPRKVYGDYLEELLDSAERTCPPLSSLQRMTGEVSRLNCTADQVMVGLTDGRSLEVDRVVLAFGHFPAVEPQLADSAVFRHARYLRDPWNTAALAAIPADAPVLLLGAGLTALDVAVTLLDGASARPIHLLSRHGLAPQAHRPGPVAASEMPLPAALFAANPTVRPVLKALRAHIRCMDKAGENWREAINALRPLTAQLWQRLGDTERRRFLRHVQPFWDNHRHRAAPAPHARFAAAVADGTVRMHAGRLVSATFAHELLQVRMRPRGAERDVGISVEHIINCIGPESNLRRVASPLIGQLLDEGMVRTDALGLGLETAEDGAVLDDQGRPSRCLFYVGPLLKARYWEATAVPELRRFAAQLAARLLDS